MSIVSEITRISGNVADAYSAANTKGATMPVSQNSDNLATTIATIPTGITPTGTVTITSNGITDVTNYANADIQVPTSAPAHYIEKTVDANGKLLNSTNIINLNGVADVNNYVLYNQYSNVSFLTPQTVEFNSLTTATGVSALESAFEGTTNLVAVNLGSLKTVIGNYCFRYTFRGCNSLRDINLSSLELISGTDAFREIFANCNGLTNISLDSLVATNAQYACEGMFSGDKGLTTATFKSLKIINKQREFDSTFRGCILLSNIYFYALNTNSFGANNNPFQNIVNSVTGCTIHFPKNLDPTGGSTVISGLSGYPNFGGTNTVLVYDLPSTVILTGTNSQAYERNPKYDTATALAWRKQDTGTVPNLVIDWTPFYTNTTNDPVVGDTIYSDASCTIAVTTIDSIA